MPLIARPVMNGIVSDKCMGLHGQVETAECALGGLQFGCNSSEAWNIDSQ